jgi:hypothetical protein
MPCDPLGPVLTADWVPVWVPVFVGSSRRFSRLSAAEPQPAMTSFEPEMLCSNRPPRTVLPTVLSDPLGQQQFVSSEDQKRRPSRLENAEAVPRHQVLGAGVSSSTTRSR